MKAIAYYRVSTTFQDFNRQKEDIKVFCKKEGIKIEEHFSEYESGLKRERPELELMMKYIETCSDIDYLIVSETSRLGRTSKVLETIDLIHKKKIGLISHKENLRTLNPDKSINPTSSFTGILLNQFVGITRLYSKNNTSIKGN